MNIRQIQNLVDKNSPEQLQRYFDLCYEQLKELNKRCQQITFYGLICGVVYFLTLNTKNLEIDMGFFKVTDLSFVVKAIPLIFSYLLWEWVLTDTHRAGVRESVATIGQKIINIPHHSKDEPLHHNIYIKDIIPFSLGSKIFSVAKVKSIAGALFTLLLMMVINAIPISFLFYSVVRSLTLYKWDFWNVMFNTIAVIFFLLSFYYQAVKFTRNYLDESEQQE